MSPHRSRRERRSEGTLPGGQGLRWVIFALLIWVGVQGAIWLGRSLAGIGLGWLVWLMFALWWIPMSLDLSGRLLRLPRGLIRVEVFKERESNAALAGGQVRSRCPHCGERVDREQALCPHCYEDLKANCRGCGRIIEAGAAQGLCEECSQAGQPRYLANEMID